MRTIFFSWQSDTNSKNRNFIEKCIKNAITSLNKTGDLDIVLRFDKDTSGLTGSPDIMQSIFRKIDKCVLFIADISLVIGETRKSPNPNVLLETGYAAKSLGWNKVVCLLNRISGGLEDVPFDLEHNRITLFDPECKDDANRIADIIKANISALFFSGEIYDNVDDYMKMKIDKCMLNVLKKASNVLGQGISMSEGLAKVNEFMNLSDLQIIEVLERSKCPSYLFLDTYETTQREVKELIKGLLSSSYYPKDWIRTLVEFDFWITRYLYYFSTRNYESYLVFEQPPLTNKLVAVSGRKLNKSNPPNSYLILEKISDNKSTVQNEGRVINVTQYPIEPAILCKLCAVNIAYIKEIQLLFSTLQKIVNDWLDLTDEFILDPEYYPIHSKKVQI